MNEPRFRNLQEALIRRGVTVRHARRAVLEMREHFHQLVQDALARGETPEAASRSADETIGPDDTLIERFAGRRELLTWSHRWPAGYLIAPLLCFGVLAVGKIIGLLYLGNLTARYLHHAPVPGIVSADINAYLSLFFLWVLPVVVAMAFGVLAYRRRIALRWPLLGIALLCAVSALLNVKFVITGGLPWGSASAGIGISQRLVPVYLIRTVSKSALACAPLIWLKLRSVRHRPLIG